MLALLNWLESPQSFVTRYYWWTYGACDPQYINEFSWRRDMCYGTLLGQNGQLNSLGRAFAAVQAAPTATPGPSSTPRPTATLDYLPGVPCWEQGGVCCWGTYDCCTGRIDSGWGSDSLGCNPDKAWPGGYWCCKQCQCTVVPTVTPVPSATNTLLPTLTSTKTASPTATAEPSSTTTPTQLPDATVMPSPTATREPSLTPTTLPSLTPTPTPTPIPPPPSSWFFRLLQSILDFLRGIWEWITGGLTKRCAIVYSIGVQSLTALSFLGCGWR